MSTQLESLGQVAITTQRMEQAIAFYRDVLGLPFLFQAGPNLAFLMAGATRIMLAGVEGNGADQSHPTLYYKVADLKAAHSAIKPKGATMVDEPHLVASMGDHELWMFFVRDPDGHLVGLMSEVRNG